MTLDERLDRFMKRNLNEARRNLRLAKEMRNLVKETVALRSEADKLLLVMRISQLRPDLLPPVTRG